MSTINSLLKAIDLMETFRPDRSVQTLTEISRRLDMPKPTVHSILATLELRGFIERTGTNGYSLGPAVIKMTQSVRLNVYLRDRAAPLLIDLARLSSESAYLAARDGDYSLCVSEYPADYRQVAGTEIGARSYLHSTAMGKAILAYSSADVLQTVLEQVGLPSKTGRTIVTAKDLEAELVKTRERGYSVEDAENDTGTYCLAAPIFDDQSEAIAACSVSSLSRSLIEERLPEVSAAVRYAAQEISLRLGYVSKRPLLQWRGRTAKSRRSGR